MFSFHKPRVYRSAEGCCICRAKSSSSRFTDSRKYEQDSMKCFNLKYPRHGEICNACVLLVKRFKRLPGGSTRHWGHVCLISINFCFTFWWLSKYYCLSEINYYRLLMHVRVQERNLFQNTKKVEMIQKLLLKVLQVIVQILDGHLIPSHSFLKNFRKYLKKVKKANWVSMLLPKGKLMDVDDLLSLG